MRLNKLSDFNRNLLHVDKVNPFDFEFKNINGMANNYWSIFFVGDCLWKFKGGRLIHTPP